VILSIIILHCKHKNVCGQIILCWFYYSWDISEAADPYLIFPHLVIPPKRWVTERLMALVKICKGKLNDMQGMQDLCDYSTEHCTLDHLSHSLCSCKIFFRTLKHRTAYNTS
jgi:hypothetical protein